MPEIDAQHQRLFALTAELHAALTMGKDDTVLEKSLAGLVDSTRVHFIAEERLMARYGFPGRAAHQTEHDKLTA